MHRFASLIALACGLSLAACGTQDSAPSTSDDSQASGDDTGTGDGDGDGSSGDGDDEASSGDGDGEASSGDGDGEALPATYWKDTKAILDQNCVNCHVEGGIGPFALETYEQVSSFAPLLAESITDGSMPPWPPNPSCNSYEHERLLPDAERELLLGWFEDGHPEGDPADAPPEPEPPAPFVSDFDVQMAEPYVPEGNPDDYRCFIIPWPEEFTEPKYVVGQVAVPGEVQQVHHVITFVADEDQADFFLDLDAADPAPGYECFGGPGKLDWTARWLGDWVPGSQAWHAPDGTGIEVRPGSYLIMQVHYNTFGAGIPDQTSLSFQIADSVDRPGTFVPVLDIGWVFGWSQMTIPAGDPNAHIGIDLDRNSTLFQYTLAPLGVGPTSEVQIWRTALHMHLLGTRARLQVTQGDTNEEQCAVQIDDWDFNWQGDYLMREPILFGPGDSMQLDCWYDNSEANQPIVDGEPLTPQQRGWGDGTYDEMCLGIVYAARTQ